MWYSLMIYFSIFLNYLFINVYKIKKGDTVEQFIEYVIEYAMFIIWR